MEHTIIKEDMFLKVYSYYSNKQEVSFSCTFSSREEFYKQKVFTSEIFMTVPKRFLNNILRSK